MDVGATMQRFAARVKSCYGDPVRFSREILGVDPHPGQQLWLRRSIKHENALVAGNRFGKSYAAAIKRIYKCTYRAGWPVALREAMDERHEPYRSVNIALTADQASLVWYKAFGILQSPRASWLVDSIRMTPFPTIVFCNGATLQSRSTTRQGVYLLGQGFDDVNWDEAAFEPKFTKIRDEVMRMRTIDRPGGSIDYTTTGNGRNEFGLYFLEGLSGKDKGLYAQTGSSYDNPYLDRARLDAIAKQLSERARQQNVEGAIVDAGGDFFNLDDLKAVTDGEQIVRIDEDGKTPIVLPIVHEQDGRSLNELVRVLAIDDEDEWAWVELQFSREQPWRLKYPSHRYIHGWDLATKQDFTVGTTWDISTSPRTLVEFERFNDTNPKKRKNWPYVKARIRDRQRRYGGVTCVDSTGVGDAILDDLVDIKAEGVNFAGGRKDEMLAVLQRMIAMREIRWPRIKPLYDEFAFYQRDDDNLIQDCVMSVAVAAWLMRRGLSAAPVGVYVPGRRV